MESERGNPSEEFGEAYLVKVKNQAELRRIKKEISDLKKKLKALEGRKGDLEESLTRIIRERCAFTHNRPPDRQGRPDGFRRAATQLAQD